MTRPISCSFQAISSGIGVCCAQAVPIHMPAITAKADATGLIPMPHISFLASVYTGLTMAFPDDCMWEGLVHSLQHHEPSHRRTDSRSHPRRDRPTVGPGRDRGGSTR